MIDILHDPTLDLEEHERNLITIEKIVNERKKHINVYVENSSVNSETLIQKTKSSVMKRCV